MSLDAIQQAEFVGQITRHQSMLRAYIISLMPGMDGVDDVLQETNIVLWEKRSNYQPGTNFRAWACAIARLEVKTQRRKMLRLGKSLLDEDLQWLAPGHGFLVAEPHAVLRALIAHRLRREAKVSAALRQAGLAAMDGLLGLVSALVPLPEALEALKIEVRVNGVWRQTVQLADLVRPAAQLLADVSDFMTLQPGDVLMLGNDCLDDGSRPLARAGDTVEISAPGFKPVVHTVVKTTGEPA